MAQKLKNASFAPSTNKPGPKENTFARIQSVQPIIDRVNTIFGNAEDLTVPGDLYIDGVANIDSLVADTADINGGTIDGAVIGGASAAAVTGTIITSGAGLVTAPGLVVGVTDNGFYEVSATQLGVSIGNALKGGFDGNGAFTDVISEQTATLGVTLDGALIKDGSFTGKQAAPTATENGLTTGLLTGADQFASVTSASADNIIALPLSTEVPIGTLIRGWVGANGFELRVDASEAATATINNVTTSVEAAIPATTMIRVIKVASLTWILTATDERGAELVIIPDAV